MIDFLNDQSTNQPVVQCHHHIKIIAFICCFSPTLHQSERKRKNAEKELTDTNVRLSEVTRQVTALTNDKRRLEGDIATIQSDLNDAISNQRAAQKRAERLADEMKQKNEDSKNAEGLRKLKESRIRDLSSRLDEIEELANQKDIMISKLMANVSAIVDATSCCGFCSCCFCSCCCKL